MHAYHDGLAAHPGWDETSRWVLDRFTWPGVRTWIKQYVKGCATCQQNKNLTHRVKVPQYKITVPIDVLPFTQVAMDLITGLPKSRGYDSILTIVNHGCSRVAVFLPCEKTITGPQIAQLYYKHLQRITLKPMGYQSGRISGSSNSSDSYPPIKTTGPQCSLSPPWYTTTPGTQRQASPPTTYSMG